MRPATMVQRWARAGALAACLAAAGCSSLSSLNPMNWWGSDFGNIPDLAPINPTQNLRVQWQAGVGAAGGSAAFFPAVLGGHIYTAAGDGTVTRLDAASGRVEWRTKLSNRLSGGTGTDGSLVAVGSSEGEVTGLSAEDGSVRWRTAVSSEVLAAPVVTGDLVLVRSSDSRIFALDAKDGRRRWVYQRSATSLSVRSPAGMAVTRGFVLAGFPGGKLVSISLTNGGVRWESTVSLPRGTSELERVTDVVGVPWLSEREVCAVAFQGRAACFDLNTGAQSWARDVSSVSGLGGDARYLYVADEKSAVNALDRSIGASVWKQDKLAGRRLSAPLALGNAIVVGDALGVVHALARDSGALVGRLNTDGSAIAAPPVALGDGFLVQTRGGNLYSIVTR
ncbi:MAG TPA: outer membrane protein assembly factor BamB [Burkholderiales bacterium]|nr:outer membrane protein assembly factor BamB [Burkholderiales bacterium]